MCRILPLSHLAFEKSGYFETVKISSTCKLVDTISGMTVIQCCDMRL